jgi:iron complex outermembrane recepter protein
VLAGGLDTTYDTKIGAYNYFDLAVGAEITEKVKFRLGVNNFLDKDPPIVSSSGLGGGGNGNTYAQVYDTLGRYIFFNVTTDF